MIPLKKATAWDLFVRDLLSRRRENLALIIGVSGKVGSGKSHWVSLLQSEIRSRTYIDIIDIPFDLWIDRVIAKENPPEYDRKFLIDRFQDDLVDLFNLQPYFQFLARHSGTDDHLKGAGTHITTHHRSRLYAQTDLRHEYVNVTEGTYESLVEPNPLSVYIVHGTLIWHRPEWRPLYAACFYVDSSWLERLARIYLRFTKGQVYSPRFGSVWPYVRYLADEARSGADHTIELQLDENVTRIANRTRTIEGMVAMRQFLDRVQERSEAEYFGVSESDLQSHLAEFTQWLLNENDETIVRARHHEIEILSKRCVRPSEQEVLSLCRSALDRNLNWNRQHFTAGSV